MSHPPSRPPHDVALEDQVAAASVDARTRTLAFGAQHDLYQREIETLDTPNGRRWETALRTTGPRACAHVSERVEVVVGPLFLPGVVMCAACLEVVMFANAATSPTICDGCGADVPERHFHALAISLGPIIISGSICCSCTAGVGFQAVCHHPPVSTR